MWCPGTPPHLHLYPFYRQLRDLYQAHHRNGLAWVPLRSLHAGTSSAALLPSPGLIAPVLMGENGLLWLDLEQLRVRRTPRNPHGPVTAPFLIWFRDVPGPVLVFWGYGRGSARLSRLPHPGAPPTHLETTTPPPLALIPHADGLTVYLPSHEGGRPERPRLLVHTHFPSYDPPQEVLVFPDLPIRPTSRSRPWEHDHVLRPWMPVALHGFTHAVLEWTHIHGDRIPYLFQALPVPRLAPVLPWSEGPLWADLVRLVPVPAIEMSPWRMLEVRGKDDYPRGRWSWPRTEALLVFPSPMLERAFVLPAPRPYDMASLPLHVLLALSPRELRVYWLPYTPPREEPIPLLYRDRVTADGRLHREAVRLDREDAWELARLALPSGPHIAWPDAPRNPLWAWYRVKNREAHLIILGEELLAGMGQVLERRDLALRVWRPQWVRGVPAPNEDRWW